MIPPGLTYLPNFISPEIEIGLVTQIDQQTWQTNLKRRVQHYGYRYDYRARRARREDYLGPLPQFLTTLAERLAGDGHVPTKPDQVIINEYQPGQGISAHIDCRPCFGEVIASLSLGSACVMRFENDARDQQYDLCLARRSLLLLSEAARYDWTHAIAPRHTDPDGPRRVKRGRRLSLTFRHIRLP